MGSKMKELTIGSHTLASREVAEMVGKEHKNILVDIRGYAVNMNNSNGLKIQPVDFKTHVQNKPGNGTRSK